jgi:hypothetical protein
MASFSRALSSVMEGEGAEYSGGAEGGESTAHSLNIRPFALDAVRALVLVNVQVEGSLPAPLCQQGVDGGTARPGRSTCTTVFMCVGCA